MPSVLSTIDPDVLTIANLVRTHQALTRQELARRTGMGRNTVSALVGTAIEAGLLVPDGSAPSTGGRAPQTWRFCQETGRILVIGVHSETLMLAVTDLGGRTLSSRTRPWQISDGPEATFTQALSDFEDMQAGLPDAARTVWGAGVSLPGPINHLTGRPTAPPIMPGWDGFDVRGWLEQRLGVGVVVDNDVNTMLLGYATSLPAQRHRDPGDILYVHFGTGIGAGLMSGGHIHRGADGAAGDIGHVRVTEADNVVCRCGRTGCLEAVAGGWALLRDARRAAKDGLSPHLKGRLHSSGALGLDDIVSGVAAGDTECLTLVVRSATAVGQALAMVVSFFNPRRVVLAGPLPEGCPLFVTAAERIVRERALTLATQGLEIIAGNHEAQDERHGAAILAVDALFAKETSA
ncbi:ROK family protein [Actinomyces faecalis]|uniref:ROK family protein n=1 Tax=Actinomyces faecalis TaxID=2722820 RepID=UPI001557317A|nr:ROK family protein [Actinomyces faecalis]